MLTMCVLNLLPEAAAAASLSDSAPTTLGVTKCVVRLLRFGLYLP
jgi:hypothetical protein